MNEVNIITSKDNPFISELSLLKDKKERLLKRKFIIEGYHLVEEAFNAGVLETLLVTNDEDISKYNNVVIYKVTDNIIKKLSSTVNPQGIVGICRIKESTTLSNKIIILDNLNDPGNLGTIIRTAATLGYNTIIAINDTVDYYNDKTIRATQGTLFKVNLLKNDISILNDLKKIGYELYGSSLHCDKTINEINHKHKYAIILGNEAHGISNDVLAECTDQFIIPMENNVESLNVSIAAAIMMWEFNK